MPLKASAKDYSAIVERGVGGGVKAQVDSVTQLALVGHASDGEESSGCSSSDDEVCGPARPSGAVPPPLAVPDAVSLPEEATHQGEQELAGAAEDEAVNTPSPVAAALDSCLRYDEHGQPGTSGFYRRWYVACPLRNCAHWGGDVKKACGRWRSVSADHCKHFGQWEPQAYLLAWAAAAPNFSDRNAHMKYIPTVKDAKAVLLQRGLLDDQ